MPEETSDQEEPTPDKGLSAKAEAKEEKKEEGEKKPADEEDMTLYVQKRLLLVMLNRWLYDIE